MQPPGMPHDLSLSLSLSLPSPSLSVAHSVDTSELISGHGCLNDWQLQCVYGGPL